MPHHIADADRRGAGLVRVPPQVILQLSAERDIVVGEVHYMHVRDGLIDPETFHLDLEKYQIVGRLFADLYTPVESSFALERMTPEEYFRRKGGE
jgi:hypothetical protein